MLCERCKKKNATVFYEENINGKARSYSLCPDCAAELEKSGDIHMQGGFFSSPSFGSFHDGMLGSLFGLPESIRTREKSCPLCHSTLNDFRRDGKMGCGECYKIFAAELSPTIRSIHGNVKHIGHAPAAYRKQNERKNRLEALKKELQEAISAEKFEEAARLRDEIRTLDSEKGEM